MKQFKNTLATALILSGFALTLFISCNDSQSGNANTVSDNSDTLFSPLSGDDTLKIERPLVDSLNNNL